MVSLHLLELFVLTQVPRDRWQRGGLMLLLVLLLLLLLVLLLMMLLLLLALPCSKPAPIG